MKKLLLILILLTPLTVQAQFSDSIVQSYANEVFENVQGYIDEYGERDGVEYAKGFTSEYMEFSMVRTMIGLITTSHGNIEVVSGWVKSDNGYQYTVAINREFVVVLFYHSESKGLLMAYSDVNEKETE